MKNNVDKELKDKLKEIGNIYISARDAYYNAKDTGDAAKIEAAKKNYIKVRDETDKEERELIALNAVKNGITNEDIDKISFLKHACILDAETERVSNSIDSKFDLVKNMQLSDFEAIKDILRPIKEVNTFIE